MKNPSDVRLSYQENAVYGATPIQLVVILYDAAIEDMQRARDAMQRGDIEARGVALRHALLVLQQLQGTLDVERGGEAAKNFEQFYNMIRAKLLEAQLRKSGELLEQQIRFMSEVRSCWLEADQRLQSSPPQSPPMAVISPELSGMGEPGATNEWTA